MIIQPLPRFSEQDRDAWQVPGNIQQVPYLTREDAEQAHLDGIENFYNWLIDRHNNTQYDIDC